MIATMGAGSEGSLKAYQLESWVTLLEKKLLQKSKDKKNNRIMLCLCFLLVPTTKESQKKSQRKQCSKVFELPTKHSLDAVVVLCSRVVGRNKELAEWLICDAMQRGPNMYFVLATYTVYVHRLYPSFF